MAHLQVAREEKKQKQEAIKQKIKDTKAANKRTQDEMADTRDELEKDSEEERTQASPPTKHCPKIGDDLAAWLTADQKVLWGQTGNILMSVLKAYECSVRTYVEPYVERPAPAMEVPERHVNAAFQDINANVALTSTGRAASAPTSLTHLRRHGHGGYHRGRGRALWLLLLLLRRTCQRCGPSTGVRDWRHSSGQGTCRPSRGHVRRGCERQEG
jgi:hypothetical protein